MFENSDRVRILSEALPYIQSFAGKTIVVKYGGAAMKESSLKANVIRDIVFMASVGIHPVVVHGGGPEINIWLDKVGLKSQFLNGLRVTDAPTMDIVEMVLTGRVNKELVSLINQAGGAAVGICGKDANLVKARPTDAEGVGFVGEVTSVNPHLIATLVEEHYIPVVSTVACDDEGQAYNINADTFAGELAAALGAEKLILLTDTPGLLQNFENPDSLITQLDIQKARELIDDGTVSGGMIPKLTCCVRTLAQGVRAAHIIDGRVSHALLLEIFTDEGIGTMIKASQLV